MTRSIATSPILRVCDVVSARIRVDPLLIDAISPSTEIFISQSALIPPFNYSP
jgi:hypothetical protein